jgi:4-hydroxybenzoate polyprenyltransferase
MDMPPIAVNLDGILVRCNTLQEGFLEYARAAPSTLRELAHAFKKGRAAGKRHIAQLVPLNPELLPYNQPLLEYLREQHRLGRRLGLFTSADQSIADAVSAHLGIFEIAVGSDGAMDLCDIRKVAAIRQLFGENFAYAGDPVAEPVVFAAAKQVVVVGGLRSQPDLVPGTLVEAAFATPSSRPEIWLKALRIEHWAKNVLVFVAPVLGFQHVTPTVALQSVLLFVALGALASATYIVNDLVDLAADRQHPRKRFRPFAAGSIQALHGAFAAAGLGTAAFLSGMLLPWAVFAALLVYLATSLVYSFALKRQPIIDVVVIAGMFTLRVVAGSLLLMPLSVSPWLLSFAMLFFLGLAMLKRYAELDRVIRNGGSSVISRGYSERDLPLLLVTGIGAGLSSVVLFLIYLIGEQYPREIYHHPGFLWGMMPLILLFILRIWHLAVHGRIDEDPVVFALTDRFSLALGATLGLILTLAWL